LRDKVLRSKSVDCFVVERGLTAYFWYYNVGFVRKCWKLMKERKDD
jgi:hypothetical protein